MTYVIYGPPGSGKTTYAKQNMSAGDIVIDFDALYSALTFQPTREHEASTFDRVENLRRYLIRTIPDFPEIRHTWVIFCAPTEKERKELSALGAQFVLMKTDERECVRRCVARGGDYVFWKRVVQKWFKENELH